MCHRKAVRSRTSGKASESESEDETEREVERPGPTEPVALVRSRLAPFVASNRAEDENDLDEKEPISH